MKILINKMIKYIKNQLKNIPMMILICILFYGIVTIATSSINSNDITFDNTNSNLNAGDMQEAIDEVFQHATDYNEIKTTIGDSTLTTTNQTLTGAVNELNNNITGVKSQIGGFVCKIVNNGSSIYIPFGSYDALVMFNNAYGTNMVLYIRNQSNVVMHGSANPSGVTINKSDTGVTLTNNIGWKLLVFAFAAS